MKANAQNAIVMIHTKQNAAIKVVNTAVVYSSSVKIVIILTIQNAKKGNKK
jgi:hypothetical protein